MVRVAPFQAVNEVTDASAGRIVLWRISIDRLADMEIKGTRRKSHFPWHFFERLFIHRRSVTHPKKALPKFGDQALSWILSRTIGWADERLVTVRHSELQQRSSDGPQGTSRNWYFNTSFECSGYRSSSGRNSLFTNEPTR